MFSSLTSRFWSAASGVASRVTNNPKASAVTALAAGVSLVNNPKGVLKAATNPAGRWFIDQAGQKLLNLFSNGSSVELERDGENIEITVRREEGSLQDSDGQMVASSWTSRAKTAVKFTMGTAALMAILKQRKPIASVLRQLPAGLTRLIRPGDLQQLYVDLQALASRSPGLLADTAHNAMVATGNAAETAGQLLEITGTFGPGLLLEGMRSAQNTAGRVIRTAAQVTPAPLRTGFAVTAQLVSSMRRGLLMAVPRPVRVGLSHASELTGRMVRFAGERIGEQVMAHPRIAAVVGIGATAAVARVAVNRIARVFRRWRNGPAQELQNPTYDLSDKASQIHEGFFSEQTVRIEDQEGGGTRFRRACINGVVTKNGAAQAKVAQMQAGLRALLSEAYQTRLDESADFGYNVDMKKGRLTIAVPSSSGNPDEYVYHRYDLQDETSIQEFMEQFGRDDLTIEEVTTFLTEQQELFEVQSFSQAPVAHAGNYEFDSAGLSRLFGGNASQLCSVMSAADYQRMLLEHRAKLGLMKDYYEQVLRSSDASDEQKTHAREQLNQIGELNTKQTVELARFLAHEMQVKARGAETAHAMSIREVIDKVSEGAMDTRELGAAFTGFVDYAEALADEDPTIHAPKRTNKESKAESDEAVVAKMKRAKVSSLVNLFIGLVTAKAKQVGMTEQMRGGIESLRGLQQRLIKSDELTVLRYDAKRIALEAELAALTYTQFQAKFEEHLGELKDQTIFDGSIYSEDDFARMISGEAAEQRADEEHTNLLEGAGITVRRRGRERSNSGPVPLMRRSSSFADRVNKLNLVTDATRHGREAQHANIHHWVNFQRMTTTAG